MFLPAMFVLDRQTFLAVGGYAEELAFGENTELALRLLFERGIPVETVPQALVTRHASTPGDRYDSSRLASAAYVLEHHPWLADRLPQLWASYHAILGTAAARQREWPAARRHFMAAAGARCSREHLGRLVLSGVPVARERVWRPAPRTQRSTNP
jgi:hypothetical protein